MFTHYVGPALAMSGVFYFFLWRTHSTASAPWPHHVLAVGGAAFMSAIVHRAMDVVYPELWELDHPAIYAGVYPFVLALVAVSICATVQAMPRRETPGEEEGLEPGAPKSGVVYASVSARSERWVAMLCAALVLLGAAALLVGTAGLLVAWLMH